MSLCDYSHSDQKHFYCAQVIGFLFIYLFLFLRQRQHEPGRGRGRGRHNLKQASGSELSAQSPMWGSNPQTARSWREPKSAALLMDWVTQPTLDYFFKCLFTYLQRECVSRGGAKREGERKSQAGSMLSAQSPTWGLISRTMRSWPELKPGVICLTSCVTQAPPPFWLLTENVN